MKIHHIGYAITNIEASIEMFRQLGYTDGNITHDESRSVDIMFMKNGNYLVELIAPRNENSPVYGVLKRSGAGTYHICYEVDNMIEAINMLKQQRWTVILEPMCAPAIENNDVCFLYNKKIGLIELVEIKAD